MNLCMNEPKHGIHPMDASECPSLGNGMSLGNALLGKVISKEVSTPLPTVGLLTLSSPAAPNMPNPSDKGLASLGRFWSEGQLRAREPQKNFRGLIPKCFES